MRLAVNAGFMPGVLFGLLSVGLLAAVIDFRTGKIPNWLTLPASVVGIAVHTALGPSNPWTMNLLYALLGYFLCGLIPFVVWKAQGMGGGDVKLLAAIGAWVGPLPGLRIQMYAYIIALLAVPLILAYRGEFFRFVRWLVAYIMPPWNKKPAQTLTLTELRMGPPIFLALTLVFAVPLLATGSRLLGF